MTNTNTAHEVTAPAAVVTGWGSTFNARRVRMTRLTPEQHAAALAGVLVIVDAPEARGSSRPHERRVVKIGPCYYTRIFPRVKGV